MHASEHDGVPFSHNGDFSGDVYIYVPEEAVEVQGDGYSKVSVSFEAVRGLVLEFMQMRAVNKLESAANGGNDELERALLGR